MSNDNSVQATGKPADEQCDHQISPLEAMAKAYWNNGDDWPHGEVDRWTALCEWSPGERDRVIDDMRAAVLALCRCDLSEQMRAMLLSIASPPQDGDRNASPNAQEAVETS